MSSHDSGNNNNKVNDDDDDAVTTDVDVVVASDNNDNAGVSDCVSLTDQRVCFDRRAFTSALRDFNLRLNYLD